MKLALVLVLVSSTAFAQPREADVPGPQAEVKSSGNPIDLPAVPDFTLTSSSTVHGVRELRVHGAKLLDSEVTVTGVVTWAYDCVLANRKPKESVAQTKRRIDEDPTLCERPKFYLGNDAKTPAEKSIWVVDLPRVYNKMELERITKAERTNPDRCEPGDTKHHLCPPYKVGDVVTLTGDWKTASPHSERNSDGLLVFKRMKSTTQKWQTDNSTWVAPSPPVAIAPAPPTRPSLPALPKTSPTRAVLANRAEIENHQRNASKALGSKQFDTAVAEAQQALAKDPEAHLAYYMMGGGEAGRGDWTKAAAAFGQAATLRPDVAMYQMWRGIAIYNELYANARTELARRENRKPEEVTVDGSTITFDTALLPLLLALQLEPKLWRANYFLGKIDRAAGADHAAAEDFTRAIAASPHESAPCVVLTELYRHWDYTDSAIKVASTCTANVIGRDGADVWYVLGMAYDDRNDHKA
ncbi:MAG TPA: tetratricopeptide repeat protein, partial [Kofleriaceae bacterium]